MEKQNYKDIVDKKEELIIVLNSKNDIVFKTKESPLSSFLKKIFTEKFEEKNLSIYVNQLGIGLAELSKVLNIKYYYGTNISIPAKEILDKSKIEFEFKRMIDLVKSSKDSEKICPIENRLNNLETFNERIEFLKEKAYEKYKTCCINFNKK